jgi:UrcA family protein
MSSERPFQKALLCIAPMLAATATFAVTSVCRASADDDPKRVVVSFADLNLESRRGTEVLNQRIHHAAERVCADLDSRELGARMRYQDCVRDATQRALADMKEVRK